MTAPDPEVVARGRERLDAALTDNAALNKPLPRSHAMALLSLTDAFAAAADLDPDDYAQAAGVLASVLDTYRRALAKIGGEQ